jgi:TolB-like protein/Tfp pilus assembly protein PilF
VPVEPAPVPAAPPQRPRGMVWASVAALLVLAVVSLYYGWRGLRPQQRPATDGHRVILAVLPFANLTGDANQDYFIDGLTAEMIIQAGRLDPAHLGVISRASVMQYKKSQEQLERIAGEMGVEYVLEGTVRRDGSHVRVTAELIQVNDRTSLWAREYDRELSGELTLQREVAQAIAGEIQATLSDRDQSEKPRNAAISPPSEAHELYLKGRYFWNKRDPAGFQHAVAYFEQAIARDPNYAPAYAGLADSYLLLTTYNLVSSKEYVPKAREAAGRALEIDPNLAEAHTSLGLLKETYDWDWQGAEKEFRRAIALDPNYATAHHWYAELLGFEGRFDEALAENDRAMQLDPLSLIIATDRGANLYFAGQYDRAIEQLRTVFDMQPAFPRARYLLIMCYVQKGNFSVALAEIEKARSIGSDDATIALQGYIYGRMGRLKDARAAMQRYKASGPGGGPYEVSTWAWLYGGVGDRDQAMVWLEKGYADHLTSLASLKSDHVWDPMRSDPRFQDMLRRVGLPQ